MRSRRSEDQISLLSWKGTGVAHIRRCPMPCKRLGVVAFLLLALSFVRYVSALAGEPADSTSFERSVAPILVKNCVPCHNPSEAKGGLDLTRLEGLLKGG